MTTLAPRNSGGSVSGGASRKLGMCGSGGDRSPIMMEAAVASMQKPLST